VTFYAQDLSDSPVKQNCANAEFPGASDDLCHQLFARFLLYLSFHIAL